MPVAAGAAASILKAMPRGKPALVQDERPTELHLPSLLHYTLSHVRGATRVCGQCQRVADSGTSLQLLATPYFGHTLFVCADCHVSQDIASSPERRM